VARVCRSLNAGICLRNPLAEHARPPRVDLHLGSDSDAGEISFHSRNASGRSKVFFRKMGLSDAC
jgi:hypothetical protein